MNDAWEVVSSCLPSCREIENMALIGACSRGSVSSAKILLEAGAWDDFALISACRKGHEEIVKLLVKEYQQQCPNKIHPYYGLARLCASDSEHYAIAEILDNAFSQ